MSQEKRPEYLCQSPVTHPTNKAKTATKHLSQIIGSKVRVEGFAWGAFEKGLGEYIVFNEGKIFVPDSDFAKRGAYGKLIRVKGKLGMSKVPWLDPGDDPVYFFYLEEVTFELIDKVEWPWVVEEQP